MGQRIKLNWGIISYEKELKKHTNPKIDHKLDIKPRIKMSYKYNCGK